MVKIGTPQNKSATRLMLLGAGELGKEVAIEAQRFGIEVIAVDKYAHAPAMQVAHRSHVIVMQDADALRKVIQQEKPDYIVPEIEAIATEALQDIQGSESTVIPSAKAVQLTMNREGIRRLAAEELGLLTSPYRFANNKEEFLSAVAEVGVPCVVKPVMSSSGKGQSVVQSAADIDAAWNISQTGGRTGPSAVIIEGFVEFDYEITLLTVQHASGTTFCDPIGHTQEDGDYRESWQPHPMNPGVLSKAQQMADAVTTALGGYGLFGVEFFIKGDDVYFSEASPRPHDTGLVTLVSQDLSEFALHVRAILGLPIPVLRQYGPSASCALLVEGDGENIHYANLDHALAVEDTHLRLFGKPEVRGRRRMGVVLSRADTIDMAREKARAACGQIVTSIA